MTQHRDILDVSSEDMEPVGVMCSSLLSLAKTQRFLAHQYRRWALEDEALGRADQYRKHCAESNRLWRSAKFHLSQARDWRH